MSLFTEFEPVAAAKPAKLKPRPAPVYEPTVDVPDVPLRKRMSIWTLPEIDSTIADLERDRAEQWDLLLPQGVLNAARLLPPEEMPLLADYILGRLHDLRSRVVEDNER